MTNTFILENVNPTGVHMVARVMSLSEDRAEASAFCAPHPLTASILMLSPQPSPE